MNTINRPRIRRADRKLAGLILLMLAGAALWQCRPRHRAMLPAAAPPPGAPAKARRGAVVDRLHGKEVPDPYRWMEEARSPRTREWLKAMDAYSRGVLARLPGRKGLAARLRELSYVDWLSPPVRKGERYFFARRHKDKEKVVYYWRQGEKGAPRVLLDPNLLSKDGSISVRGVQVDHQGLRAAYKLSRNNSDESELMVMEVATGRNSAIDKIPGAKYARPSWTPGGEGFYYTRLPVDPSIPVADRPGHAAVYFHRLGESHTRDRLVHGKTGDPRKFIHPQLSRDGRHLFIYVYHGWIRADVYFRRESERGVEGGFKPLAVGKKAIYGCYSWKNRIYIRTNEGALNYRLFKVDPDNPGRASWRELIKEQKEGVLKGFAVVGGHLALQYIRRATTRLRIATLEGKVLRDVSFPGLGSASQLSGNPEDDAAYYSFSSFIRPTTIYRTSVSRGGRQVYFQLRLPIDSRPYLVEQVFYPSRDGTRVSMFIIRPRKMPLDGSTPFMLYGYGGFNISLTPRFRPSYFVWLEKGGAIAIPNLRGGGEYGEAWHRAGMLLKKQNTFDDFIAAAEYLIRKKYTRPAKLAIRGGSNGGLLVGAAMTQRPALFRAVACHVPLLDMVRYHLFGSGKTWIGEYGSSEDPAQFKALLAYSPYHRVKRGTSYPALLMMSADSDDRVDPVHARKFTAAIRWATVSPHPVLMRVETRSGHGGGDMVKKRVAARIDEFAFLFRELGVGL